MEYFTRLLKVAGNNPQFAYHPSCRSIRLNHLMSADDVIIFCKAHPQTLSIIHHTLMAFFYYAGLLANQEKSQIVFGGCTPTLQWQCLEAIGFQEGSLPMRYLGVPVTASRLSKIECRALVEKIMGKIRLWATKSIFFAGRAQLLNSIVFGMISYWASIFILPQEVIDQLNQICRNYLWGGKAEYQKSPYISWTKTCTPRKYGGIGLKNLGAWNKACIAKLIVSGSNRCMKDTLNSRVRGIIGHHLTAVVKASLTAYHGSGKRARTTLSKKATSGCFGRWNIRDGVRLYGLEQQHLDTHQQLGCSSIKDSLSKAE
ncbi:hypothetical protein Cgig2_020746 [Carnegiea gigantea]|uniref:Reverse transcriptase n=1 Tax=Carnegiea gigantea TaxID=171969 RepID=A0A9Q1GPI2_9CARY|nr:hypothetical protein Cgig2_020746 [Carnegiea gigantea]